MPLAELLVSIMDAAKELLRSEGCSLLLSDQTTGDLIFDVVIGDKGNIIRGERVPKGMGIAGTVAMNMEPIIADDARNDPRWYHDIDQKFEFHTRNLLCVPMLVMGDFMGVLEVVNSIGRKRYTGQDLDRALYIAGQAAIAINNRRMYDDLTNRINELSALYDVAQSISLSNPDDDIIGNICKSLARSMNVRRVSIIFFDEDEGRLRIEASHGLPDAVDVGYEIDINASIAGHVFRGGDPMLVSNVKKEIPKEMLSAGSNYQTDSFVSVPIRYNNKTIGVLSCADKINGKNFDSFDLRIATTVCSQVSQLHNNIISRQDLEKQRKLSNEIEIAAEIQKKILQKVPRTFGRHELAVFNQPAKIVGGDFYDFYRLDDNKYSIQVADISGKGIPAALFMGLALNVVRAERRVDSSPAGLLRNANRYICQDSESGMFVTIFYAVIDSHNNLFTYASAGHNDQLLVRARTKKIEELNAAGRALGLAHEQTYEERVVLYEPGDMLVMFTDGVTECFGGSRLDIEHGQRELGDIALTFMDDGPTAMIEYLKKYFQASNTDMDFVDDITILAVKF